jgi:osmoprotectant transport system ATP-binding protein
MLEKGQSMMELRAVSASYGGQTVLYPTDLTFTTGQTTVLIGPSGCGKSTVLRLLVGLLQPDSGEVLFEGHPVSPASVLGVRRLLGYVIQDGGLFPHLTARGNVTLMAEYLGWKQERIEHRLSELVELSHFPADGLERYPAQLSGGQRQRVALMRALMLDPAALLLDEPLGALDPLIRADLQEDLRRIFQTLGKTVVLVTHDLGEADYFADTIVLMRAGRVLQQGKLAQLWRAPADPFVSRFIQAQRGPALLEDPSS